MSDTEPQQPRARRPPARRASARAPLRSRFGAVVTWLAAVLAVAVVVALSLHAHLPFGLSSAGHTTPPARRRPTGATGAVKPASGRTVSVSAIGTLSAPASRVAAVPYGTGGALFLGGYDATNAPTDTVQNYQAATVTSGAAAPIPLASAVAAVLGPNIYVFGGVGSSAIYELTGTSFAAVGSLPAVTADAAVATVGNTAFVIGGYNGTTELNTIVAYTPGSPAQTVAMLPVTLRYAAAAALDGDVYIIGGATAGVPSATIYRFDPQTNSVVVFAALPRARERQSAATLGNRIYVIGGATAAGVRSRAIYAINTASGAVRLAGLLPHALADTAAVGAGNQIIVAGGTNDAMAAVATIYAVAPVSP